MGVRPVTFSSIALNTASAGQCDCNKLTPPSLLGERNATPERGQAVSVWPAWQIFVVSRSMVLALPSKVSGLCSRESGSAWSILQYTAPQV